MPRESASRLRGQLLVECLGTALGDSLLEELRRLSDVDWHCLVDDATRHGVAPLLHRRLQANGHTSMPLGVRRKLSDLHLHNHLKNTAVFEQLADVLSQLHRLGIPVMPLKGAQLARQVYEDPALRPMQDLDLLVKASDLPAVQEALNGAGYRATKTGRNIDYSRHHHVQAVSKRGAIPIEVHHHLVQANNPFTIDIEAIWRRAVEAVVAGVPVSVLSPEDLILHLCTHAAYNNRFRIPLLALCDIDTAVQQCRDAIDWDQLVQVANADGRGRFIYSALLLVQRTLGTALPSAELDGLQHDRADDEVVDVVQEYVFAPPHELPTTLKRIRRIEGVGGKARALVQAVFPSPELLRVMYRLPARSKSVHWYYLWRPVDLIARGGGVLLGILFRSRRAQLAVKRDRLSETIDRWVNGSNRQSHPPPPLPPIPRGQPTSSKRS